MKAAAIFVLVGAAVPLAGAAADSREFFEKQIRPVFAKSCFACHNGANRMSGLDMSSRDALLKGGREGPALVPGKPEESLLILAVNHRHERLRMPMGQSRLSDPEIRDLVDWVKAGAPWPEAVATVAPTPAGKKFEMTAAQRAFWSLQPIRRPAVPAVKNAAWARTDIDRFLLARMEARGVAPSPAADKRTLLRRVSYDLTGLPPSLAEVEAFERDASAGAYEKAVERLLASPRYGERWGRHWLDVARYSDDQLEAEVEAPYENAFRYRDWVIEAFNRDMPYDQFVKAQIAGDLMGDRDRYAGGLGFFGLRPHTQDDRVDITGRAFLGMTVGCAQCHDHKFDPIPTTDYYALLGVFESTRDSEHPLVPAAAVKEWKALDAAVRDKKAEIQSFLHAQATQLAELLAAQTERYVLAARAIQQGKDTVDSAVAREKFDRETLSRWMQYLGRGKWDHPWLDDYSKASFDAAKFQKQVLTVLRERKAVDEKNLVLAAQGKKDGAVSLETKTFYLWRDLFFNDFYGRQFKQEDDGLLYYGPNRGYYESDGTIERFLEGQWKNHLNRLREELAARQAKRPPHYAFFHTIEDSDKPHDERVRVGGKAESLGELVPRRFLSALSDGAPFKIGSGRKELAELIASPQNPLTARVIVNRVWHHHFGLGLVKTPSDLGFMGDRPSHPELIDYLASRLIEQGWSLKALHREIVLSSAYRASAAREAKAEELDPENRLFRRANVRRLEAEELRDSLLAATGELELTVGGPPVKIGDATNRRRSVYGFVSRSKIDGTLGLFDFPNANQTNEKRTVTMTPSQQLFLMNSGFVMERARRLAESLPAKATAAERVTELYRKIYARRPAEAELKLGLEYAAGGDWAAYAQALLSANEFVMVN